MKTWTSTSGLKARSSRANWLWLLLWLTTPTLADTAAEPAPELELLEFLGEWQDDGGHWIDPLQLSETSDPDHTDAAPQTAQAKEQKSD